MVLQIIRNSYGGNATEEIAEADEYIDFRNTIFEEENKTVPE